MESALIKKNNNENMDIGVSSIVPSTKDLESLELSDLVIMNYISHDFDKRFKCFFKRDSFTVTDPFTDSDTYLSYLFIDRNNYRNVISMVVVRKDIDIKKDIWDKIRGVDIMMLGIKPEQANKIKEELMPKDTNNFYPFRQDGIVVGYIMFAYQICGLQIE